MWRLDSSTVMNWLCLNANAVHGLEKKQWGGGGGEGNGKEKRGVKGGG